MAERKGAGKAAPKAAPKAARPSRTDGERAALDTSAVLARIAAMAPADRALGERIHAIVSASAPELAPRLWYGMPAYAKDGQVVCFFQDAGKFKVRYATLGFSDRATLDEGHMWPSSFALTELTAADEARIAALVKRAVGPRSTSGQSSESSAGSAAPARPTLGAVTPILRVASLDASLAYYVERLGFTLEWRAEPVASVRRDRTALMLCEGDQGRPGTWLWIAADDVDALYAELGARGARLRLPPGNYPWGSRECQVADLDDHVLRFGSDLRAGAPMGAWLDGEGQRWLPQADGGWRAAE